MAATDTGDPSKIEIEIALRDSFSVAFRAMAQEMSAANRKAQESSRGGGGFAELEKMVGSISKSLLGPLGIAGGLYAAARSLDTFAVGQLQMKNFARDTGFAKDEITLMRQQLGTLGVPLAQADQMIGSMGGKLTEAMALPWGTNMIKMLNDSNPALARQVQQYASAGQNMKALDAIYNTYIKSNKAGQAAIQLATGMSATAILAHGQDVKGLLKPWKDLDEGSSEYHKKMMSLDQSFKNIWQSVSQNAIKNITEMAGGFESLDKSAHKIAETINEDMNKSFKTLNEYLALYKKLKEHPVDFALDELEDIGRKIFRMQRKLRSQDPDTDDNTTLEFSNKARRPAGEELKDLNATEEDSNKILRDMRDILDRMESGKPAPGGGTGGGPGVGGGGGAGGAEIGGPGGPMGRLSGGGGVSMGGSKRDTAAIVADEWRKAGMSEAGIAGLMANIRSESNFDPTLRHADQPRFSGEAHFAHGLYQEGGTEWNNYAKWLKETHPEGDWRDPKFQSEFAAYRLKTGYPKVWEQMQRGTKEEAAEAYLRGYLKPAAGHMANRAAQYRRGVPGVESYLPSKEGAGWQSDAGGDLAYVLAHGGHKAVTGRGEDAPETNPELVARMAEAGRRFKAETGQEPRFGEMGRSNALQAIYRSRYESGTGGIAAREGQSRHNVGEATDVPSGPFRDWLYRGGAARLGMNFPVRGDAPHMQMDPRYRGPSFFKPETETAGAELKPFERFGGIGSLKGPTAFEQRFSGAPDTDVITESLKKKTADTKSVSGTLSAEVDFKNAAFTKSAGDAPRFKPLKITSAFTQNQRPGEGMLYPTDTEHTPWVP